MYDVWKNVLAELEQKFKSDVFVTWFKDTCLVSNEDGKVVIGVKNPFFVKQLCVRYYKEISEALKNNGVEAKDISCVVQTQSKVRNKPREVSINDIVKKTSIDEKKPKFTKTSTDSVSNGLNSRYTFDNFVIGSNNDLAVGAAKCIVDAPGTRYNPFFLYGGPGLGKTHLIHAIGNELLRRNPDFKILYTPISHFYSDFINSIQAGKGKEFSKKFQKLDVLIIDDFQQIVGKEKSQEEFFNDLYQLNKQIIVTSDRLPSQIKSVDERLASRLTWAGAFDLQLPKFEDKCAILKAKAEIEGRDIEPEAIEYIAENVNTNIRDLEGELSRILLMSEIRGVTPLELINNGAASINKTSGKMRSVSAKQIIEKVAKYYQLTVKEMCGKSRVANIKTARQVAMFLLSKELNMSTPKIASEVGVKDHTTVMHGIKKIESDIKLKFDLRDQVEEIKEKIYG